MNQIKEYTEKIFEDIKHIDELGNEYWSKIPTLVEQILKNKKTKTK